MCTDGDDGDDAITEMSKRSGQLLHHFCANYINFAAIVSLAHSLTRLSRFSGAHCMHVSGDMYLFYFLDFGLVVQAFNQDPRPLPLRADA